ncbi:MAG: hypothetical protein PVG11_09325 [Anaerolineae bacterium]|jgi:hypothetical protein
MKRAALLLLLVGLLLLGAAGLWGMIPAARAQATGQITSPRDRAAVQGLVPVEGSATHPQFQKYEIHFGPEPNPGDQWTPIGGSPFTAPVVQGRLGLWDTTVIPDGVYSLRLRVVRLDGNYDEYYVRGIQVSNAQPIDTPTPEESPTPEGSPTPTDTPPPTPTVVIGVPTVSSPTPRPTETPLPTLPPAATTEPPVDVPFGSVSDAVCWGAAGTIGLFVLVGLFFAFKSGLVSAARWLARRGREGLGVYED